MADDSSDVEQADPGVRVTVDREACMGIGQCEMLEPDVFEIDDEGIAVVVDGTHMPRARAVEVIDRCPSQAISLVDDES